LKDVLGFHNDVIVSPPMMTAAPESVLIETMPVAYTYEYEGHNTVDMRAGVDTMYVYTDIVESRVVGDVYAPLLRNISVYGTHGSITSETFDRVQYVKLLRHQFDTVEVDIRDDFGQPIPFEQGKLVVTLHIRRCKSKLF
ncbi:hypothetical protein DJ031_00125, partial [bacterium endosymbiont of Escarpia laminata]